MKKIAILVDGGYFTKKYHNEIDNNGPTAPDISRYCHALLNELYGEDGELYRIFYYDAEPYRGSAVNPLSGQLVDFEQTNVFKRQTKLLEDLRFCDYLAIRLGHLMLKSDTWQIKPRIKDQIIQKQIKLADLQPEHIEPSFEQKGVDIKIGLDIATLSYKALVDAVVIVSGDQDFIPAMKLAREEGMTVIYHTLGHRVTSHLIQHCDRFVSDIPKAFANRKPKETRPEATQERPPQAPQPTRDNTQNQQPTREKVQNPQPAREKSGQKPRQQNQSKPAPGTTIVEPTKGTGRKVGTGKKPVKKP